MSVTGQSLTLANSIIGVGILAMPFCFQQCGVLLATLILILMGLVSRLCSYFLLKSALIARRRNFEFLAFNVFGAAGKLAVEVGIIGFLMGTCIAYFVVVGDLGPQIVAKILNINQSDVLRTSIMVIVSLVCVLPLGLLRNVDSLSNVSAATIGFYICLVMKIIAEAASQMLSTSWHSKVELWRPAGVLQCVPIFSMALFCQTQLFEVFGSMPIFSLEKMSVVTKNAINICTCVYLTLGVFGYIAFSSQTISGNILMSLSPTMTSDVIKLGFVMSVAFSFPLIIFPCRASLYSLIYRKVHPSHHDSIIKHSMPDGTFRFITVSIVGVSLFISVLVPNIELVLGLLGSTVGVMICVVFPAACFVNVTYKDTNERILAKVVLVLGLFIMVLGTYANLQAAENTIDRYDDKYITPERIDKIVEEFFQAKKQEKSEDFIENPMSKEEEKNIPEVKPHIESKEEKDSAIQPPNPVPPESQSKERLVLQPKDDVKIKQPEIIQKDDKHSKFESHPKNLNGVKDDTKNANGAILEEPIQKERAEAKPAKPAEEEKLDMLKQKKLIETIKQHGEEQKELIKEQREILDELKKTKEELQTNKKENVDSNEAKKIAVQSIQKIADMAIKSLSGVSDKPDEKEKDISDIKSKQNLEETANKAVQEIAKKAVETMEAIKESEGKAKAAKSMESVQPGPNNVNNVPVPQVNSVQNAQQAQANIQPIVSANNGVNPPLPPVQPSNVNNIPQQQQNFVNQAIPPNNLNQVPVGQLNNVPKQQIPQNIDQPVPQINNVPNQPVQQNVVSNPPLVQGYKGNPPNNIINQPAVQANQVNNPPVAQPSKLDLSANRPDQLINPNINNKVEENKPHSHSPDEPQSYIRGEDLQVAKNNENSNGFNNNIPIPLAINPGSNLNQIQNGGNQNEAAPAPQNINQQQNNAQNIANGAIPNNIQTVNQVQIPQEMNVIRHKREIIDCSQSNLKLEEKLICDNIAQNNVNIAHDLPPVDLEKEVARLPIDLHHVRSLKSFDEEKGR